MIARSTLLLLASLMAAPCGGPAQGQALVVPAAPWFGVALPAGMGPPWLWVSAGQPVLMSPLWASAPAVAAIAPAPWGLWETAFHRGRSPDYALFGNVEAHVGAWPRGGVDARSSGAGTLNWNAITVLNSGDSHAR